MDKVHILNEIRRTAAVNSGVALGIRTFAKETGIKDADWLGKYWARWSDAVKEAGLTPNEKQSAFDIADILEKVILLSRAHGRLPFKAEMQMESHKNENFPSITTIYERLGNSKSARAKKIREYCVSKSGCDDVIVMCDSVLSSDHPTEIRTKESDFERGFVYLIKSGKHYKIGRSISVGQRERQLAIQLPDKASTIHSIATDDPIGIEVYWHKRFESKRKNGEWFELNAEDINAFKRRKFM